MEKNTNPATRDPTSISQCYSINTVNNVNSKRTITDCSSEDSVNEDNIPTLIPRM